MKLSLALLLMLTTVTSMTHAKDPIAIADDHPSHWSFRGPTAPLVGGSSEDNLFQEAGMEEELKALATAGGNYVRCSMSSRDPGNVWPFLCDPQTGLYDLDRFDPEYWRRFERLIALADNLLVVTDPEPPAPESPLYDLENVFITPHIAGSIGNECGRMGQYMVEECRRFLHGEPLCYQITREAFLQLA